MNPETTACAMWRLTAEAMLQGPPPAQFLQRQRPRQGLCLYRGHGVTILTTATTTQAVIHRGTLN